MRTAGAITLFSEQPPSPGRPSPFLASAVLHVVTIGLIWYGMHRVPRIVTPAERYTVKLLNLDQPPPPVNRGAPDSAAISAPSFGAASASGAAPSPLLARQQARAGMAPDVDTQARRPAPAPEGRPAPASAPKLLVQEAKAPRTLLQPDLPPNLLPQTALLPKIVIWMPKVTAVKVLTPPPPQEVTIARVQPSPAPPNTAPRLADIKIAPSESTTKLPTLPPSTSSPIAVQGPSVVNQIPETASRRVTAPTPARVMSLSNLQLEKGTVALPGVSEIAPGSSTSVAGNLPALSSGNRGTLPSPRSGAGVVGNGEGIHSGANGAGTPGFPSRAKGSAAGSGGGGMGRGNGSGEIAGAGAGRLGSQGEGSHGAGSGMPDGPGGYAVTRIRHPKDGQFGFVVVGGSIAEQYSEIPNLWGGRLAYSVYLQVGLAKNWILQYALPKSPEAGPAAASTQPQAPWPYTIVRPHLDPNDWDADAILVHGFVNATGHFEKLAVVFPSQFPQTKFVIDSLDQWQFRPATENGRASAVEILLIIPDQDE